MDQTQPELRVMVDTNTLIAGSVWPRWYFEVLQHALRGDSHLVLSNYILQQSRAHIQTRFPDYSDQFDELLQACRYELVADPTREQVTQHIDLVRDPSDEPVALDPPLRACWMKIGQQKRIPATPGRDKSRNGTFLVAITGSMTRSHGQPL